MIKYYVRTFYRLPPSKWILSDLSEVPSIIESMMVKKPSSRRLSEDALNDSVSVVKFDTEKLVNWKQVFLEFKNWDWLDMENLHK